MIISGKNTNENHKSNINSSNPILEILAPNVFLGALKKNEWDKNQTIIARFIEVSGVSSGSFPTPP